MSDEMQIEPSLDEAPETTGKPKRQRAPAKWRIGMAIAGVLLVMVVLAYMFVGAASSSRVGTTSAGAINPGSAGSTVGGGGSPYYNSAVEEENREKAERALRERRSFVPTPVDADKKDALPTELFEPKPMVAEKPVQAPMPAPMIAPQPVGPVSANNVTLEQERNRLRQAFSAQLGVLGVKSTDARPEHARTLWVQPVQSAASPAAPSPTQTSSAAATAQMPGAPVKAGDLIIAVNKLIIDSDAGDSAVWVVVPTGTHREATFFGKFERRGEYLNLSFDRMIMPDGSNHRVSAVAIDPSTPRSTIRSYVDAKTFERWASFIGSVFISGFAEAVGNSGANRTTSTGTTGTVTSTTLPEYDTTQQAWIAAGRVAEKVAPILEKKLDLPPRVVLRANEAIGILILDAPRTNQ